MRYLICGLVLFCAGCQTWIPPDANEWDQPPPVVEIEQVVYWLQTVDSYMKLEPGQAADRLQRLKPESKLPLDAFRRGLLNQQLGHRDGWVAARDIFRGLQQQKSLAEDLKWLTGILTRYNQALINANERFAKLTAQLEAKTTQLEASRASVTALEEKVTALTNLERAISTRKEQAVEEQEQGHEE